MSRPAACDYEKAVLRATRSGAWTDALREHAASCEDCGAAMTAAPFLDTLAAFDVRQHRLPDPAVVWMKAQLLRTSVVVDRAARPIRIAQFIAYFVIAACWATLLTWKWAALESWVSAFMPAHFVEGAAAGASLSAAFFAALFLLSSATIVVALHTIVAED